MAVYNSIDEFRNEFRLTSIQIYDSEVERSLQQANDHIVFNCPEITSTSYPSENDARLATIPRILAKAERYFAFGYFIQSITFYSRYAKLDLNILSLPGVSRGADSPSPLESSTRLFQLGTEQLDIARQILKNIKPRPYGTKRYSPSPDFWRSKHDRFCR